MKIFILSALVSFLVTGTALAAPDKMYNAETFTLKNGLQVVVIPNHRAPVVTHMVWYKVGAADEPQGDGVSGAAHFLEHLMFKGSIAIPPGDFSKIIRAKGGEDNAFTSWDFTAYFQSIAKERLPMVMALEADRMINIAFPEKDVISEKDVIIEERRMRTDNDPQTLFSEQIRAALFNSTPYAVPIIGWRDEMPKLSAKEPMAYYKTWYAPNNAILVVSGDITAAELKPLAEKYYGILPPKTIPPHIRPLTPDFPALEILTFHSPDVRQSVLIRAIRAPGFMMDKKTSDALDVLQETLSGGASTILYQSLVVQQKLATSIDLSYDGSTRGEGSIWIYATPADGVSVQQLDAALNTEMSHLIKDGISDADIAKAKTRMVDSALYAKDSVMGPAMTIGESLAYGATLDDVETWPARIEAVNPDDVRAALRTYLSPSSAKHPTITGYLLPEMQPAPVSPTPSAHRVPSAAPATSATKDHRS